MLVKWSLILVFYITDPRQLVQCVAGDDVEESFYLDGPRSRMYIGVAGQHVDSGG